MKIVHLTPGTGNFVCGNCVRDNALVHELRRMGHDVMMMPLYLPLVTDGVNAAGDEAPVFFGGVNVYLQHKSPLFRHTPRWLDNMLDNRSLLRWTADHSHMTTPSQLGELTLATLKGIDGTQRKEIEKLIEWLQGHERPDLLVLTNSLLLGLGCAVREALGIPMVLTFHGDDAFINSFPEPWRSQCWAVMQQRLTQVDAAVAVSQTYAEILRSELNFAPGQLHVVHNGIDLAGFPAEPPSPPQPPVVGYLARMGPEKGLHVLIDAFIELKRRPAGRDAKLRVAGAQTPGDLPFVTEQHHKLREAGCLGDASFHPNLRREEKIDFLRGLSVFSVPATYGEAFGLYLLEAAAAGVPVVQPRHAAFPEIVGRLGNGLLVEPDNPTALADGLAQILADTPRAQSLAQAGRECVHREFSMTRMARDVLNVYNSVLEIEQKEAPNHGL